MLETVTPNPRTWTLRFKNGKVTILVEVDPLQTLPNVRAELLRAIQQTHPDGILNGRAIPKNPDEIKLGKPVDINDLNEGYIRLEAEGDLESPIGKGKGKASIAKAKTGSLKACPQSVGLRDGGLVAFKFENEDDVAVHDEDDFAVIQEKWDVIVPTLEETYDDEEAEDEGIGMDEQAG